MSRTKQPPRATLGDRDSAAIWALRYCLGRQTYVVPMCVEWLIDAWPLLDQHAKAIIARDLKEEIRSLWRAGSIPAPGIKDLRGGGNWR